MAKCITCDNLQWVVTCPVCHGVSSVSCTKCWRRGYLPDYKARHLLRCPDCEQKGSPKEWSVGDTPWVWYQDKAVQTKIKKIQGASYQCWVGKLEAWFTYQELRGTEAEVWTDRKLEADVRLHEAIKAEFELNSKYLESKGLKR